MKQKDRIVYTSDPQIVADIERNDFHSPIPVIATKTGYWVPHWSMEQYRERAGREHTLREGVPD